MGYKPALAKTVALLAETAAAALIRLRSQR
jgi:hypothetical protein